MSRYLKYVVLVLFAVVFAGGFWLGKASVILPSEQNVANQELGKSPFVDFSIFWQAWNLIEARYVGRNDLNRQEMVYGAIEGLVNSLGDPHSLFLTPRQNDNFFDELEGTFDGIGVEIGIRDGILTVVSPLEGTPAKKAGLEAGDKILEVDGNTTTDLSLDESVSRIKGEQGTEVTLTVLKEGQSEPQEVKIVRDEINIPVLKTEVQDNYAYIQIFSFSQNVDREFKKAVADNLLERELKGVIIDLRNNPGGFLEKAVDISGWFLEKDQVVVSEDYGNGQKEDHKAGGPAKLIDFPVVLLVNQGSASASEIVAGALKDYGKAKLVGETTFGKGSIQKLELLEDGSSLKITIARWLTPLGHSIDQQGIVPDYEVELTGQDIEENKDPQKEKAIEVLQEMIKAQ